MGPKCTIKETAPSEIIILPIIIPIIVLLDNTIQWFDRLLKKLTNYILERQLLVKPQYPTEGYKGSLNRLIILQIENLFVVANH